MCLCRGVPFGELLPRARAGGLGPRVADARDRLRRAVRAVPAVSAAHACDRRNHLSRAAVGRAPRMNRWHLAGTNAIRLVGAIALVIGWAGVYYAFQGHWLGILLALLATVITFGAVRVGDMRARAQNAALRDALASAAARNRELERLRRVAATLLGSSELGVLLQEIADAAADLLQAESSAVALVVEEGRFLRVAAVTGPLAPAMGCARPRGRLAGRHGRVQRHAHRDERHERRPAQLPDAGSGCPAPHGSDRAAPLRRRRHRYRQRVQPSRRAAVHGTRPPAARDPGRPGGGRPRSRRGAGRDPPERAQPGGEEHGAAAGRPAQGRVPRQHEPRAAHPAQRHHRVLRSHAHRETWAR